MNKFMNEECNWYGCNNELVIKSINQYIYKFKLKKVQNLVIWISKQIYKQKCINE